MSNPHIQLGGLTHLPLYYARLQTGCAPGFYTYLPAARGISGSFAFYERAAETAGFEPRANIRPLFMTRPAAGPQLTGCRPEGFFTGYARQ